MDRKNDGFIGLIIMIILALAAAKYFFGWSIFDAAESEEGQGTIAYIRQVLDTIWHYLGAPLTWIWNEIVRPLIGLIFDNFGSSQSN